MRLTKKQRQIMDVVLNEPVLGEECRWNDVHLICEKVPYEVSKHAMMFSLRYLVSKGMLIKTAEIKRRERWVIPYEPTNLAYDVLTLSSAPSEIEIDGIIETF